VNDRLYKIRQLGTQAVKMEATNNLRGTGDMIKSAIQIAKDESNVYSGLENILTL
jgi:hypothetical protein